MDIEKAITYDDDIIKNEEGGLIFNPYNSLNIEITLNDVQSILTTYGVPNIVDNINLYKRAFVHRSYTKRPHLENISQNITIVSKPDDCLSLKTKSNERLEFLGDSILGFVVAQKLYDLFPSASEGVLSRLRASLVNQSSLAELARQHQLGDYLLLGSGELKSGGFRRDSILSDALEAIMGALFKDQGINACQTWIELLFAEKLNDLSLDNWQKDPKTQLQELMQSKKQVLPEYTLITMSGLAHEQMFQVKCSIPLLTDTCVGTGISRKKAEQSAAELMLELLNKDSI